METAWRQQAHTPAGTAPARLPASRSAARPSRSWSPSPRAGPPGRSASRSPGATSRPRRLRRACRSRRSRGSTRRPRRGSRSFRSSCRPPRACPRSAGRSRRGPMASRHHFQTPSSKVMWSTRETRARVEVVRGEVASALVVGGHDQRRRPRGTSGSRRSSAGGSPCGRGATRASSRPRPSRRRAAARRSTWRPAADQRLEVLHRRASARSRARRSPPRPPRPPGRPAPRRGRGPSPRSRGR